MGVSNVKLTEWGISTDSWGIGGAPLSISRNGLDEFLVDLPFSASSNGADDNELQKNSVPSSLSHMSAHEVEFPKSIVLYKLASDVAIVVKKRIFLAGRL